MGGAEAESSVTEGHLRKPGYITGRLVGTIEIIFDGEAMPPVEWPTCAICNKQVERMEGDFDPQADEYVFIACCHGEREEVRIPRLDFAEGNKIVEGARAFEPKVEPAEARRITDG